MVSMAWRACVAGIWCPRGLWGQRGVSGGGGKEVKTVGPIAEGRAQATLTNGLPVWLPGRCLA